jgi:hypothetical protein
LFLRHYETERRETEPAGRADRAGVSR